MLDIKERNKMTVYFGRRFICDKCKTDLEIMILWGKEMNYCPKCTNPNKKKLSPDVVKAIVSTESFIDKRKVEKEVWGGKIKAVVNRKKKIKKKPNMFCLKHKDRLSSARILYDRKNQI